MARFMGLAVCLVLPSLVATAGMEAWGDDASALLQVDTAMASIQTEESLAKSVVSLRSLLAVAQNAAREHSASSPDSTEFYMSKVQPQMEKASKFIVNKLETLSATNKSKSRSGPCIGCWVVAAIDALIVGYEASTSQTSQYQKCSPAVLVVWWLTGILTMHLEQGLPLQDAMDMLAQQFTSVGYGSSDQTSPGLKIFHGLHGLVSQMSVSGPITAMFEVALQGFENFVAKQTSGGEPDVKSALTSLLIITALTTFLFAADLGAADGKLALLDGFYQALITMTTIGYGDMSPTTPWAKALAPWSLPLLTGAWSRFADASGSEAQEKNADVKKGGTFTADLDICKCFGRNFCEELAAR